MRRIILVTAVAITLALAASTTAVAGQKERFRTDGKGANAYWTQVDGPPGANQPFGNVHVGWLDSFESSTGKADVYVYVDDFSCPVGVLPSDWWGHGEEPTGPKCTYITSRFGEGYGLTLTVDKKLSSATLKGTVTMSVHGGHGESGPVVGTPAVNMTWAGSGPTNRSVYTYRDSYGRSRYSDRYSSQSRNAVVTGNIGPMGFAPDLSGGQISTYRSMYSWSSK